MPWREVLDVTVYNTLQLKRKKKKERKKPIVSICLSERNHNQTKLKANRNYNLIFFFPSPPPGSIMVVTLAELLQCLGRSWPCNWSILGNDQSFFTLVFHAKYLLFSCLYLLHSLNAAKRTCMETGRKKGCAKSGRKHKPS